MIQLNPHQFATIFEALRIAGKNGESDKRHSTRMQVQAKLKVATLEKGRVVHCLSALTRDVSACGVGLFQYVPFESGTRFLACFPEGKHQLIVVCVSRFCRVLAEGLFGIGAEFESIAEPALVKQLEHFDEDAAGRIRNSILG